MPEDHLQYHEEVNNWHYVRSEVFLYADLLFGLQMVDRMHRHGQVEQLANYTRQLIMERFASQPHTRTHTTSFCPLLLSRCPCCSPHGSARLCVVGCRSEAQPSHHHGGEGHGSGFRNWGSSTRLPVIWYRLDCDVYQLAHTDAELLSKYLYLFVLTPFPEELAVVLSRLRVHTLRFPGPETPSQVIRQRPNFGLDCLPRTRDARRSVVSGRRLGSRSFSALRVCGHVSRKLEW